MRASQFTEGYPDQACNYILGMGLPELLENSITLHAVKQN